MAILLFLTYIVFRSKSLHSDSFNSVSPSHFRPLFSFCIPYVYVSIIISKLQAKQQRNRLRAILVLPTELLLPFSCCEVV